MARLVSEEKATGTLAHYSLFFAFIVRFRSLGGRGCIGGLHGGQLLCGGLGIGVGGVDLLGLCLVIVDDVDDVLLSSQEGIIIRLHANEIPLQSRYGSGVRVMRLGENDKVMVLARTDHDDEAQTEKIDASEADAEPTAEQLAEMEAADAAAATEAPEADPEEKE